MLQNVLQMLQKIKNNEKMHIDNKSENRIQAECVIWYRNEYCRKGSPMQNPLNLIAHVKNEHKGGYDATIHAGFSDLILFHGSPLPVFIEVKEPGNKSGPLKNGQSEKQISFEAWCKAIGRPYHVVRSLDAFKAIIEGL